LFTINIFLLCQRISTQEMVLQLPLLTKDDIVPFDVPKRQHKTIKELLEFDPYTIPVTYIFYKIQQ
jgi:hypothetical protein